MNSFIQKKKEKKEREGKNFFIQNSDIFDTKYGYFKIK